MTQCYNKLSILAIACRFIGKLLLLLTMPLGILHCVPVDRRLRDGERWRTSPQCWNHQSTSARAHDSKASIASALSAMSEVRISTCFTILCSACTNTEPSFSIVYRTRACDAYNQSNKCKFKGSASALFPLIPTYGAQLHPCGQA